jgi:hypothetical protein
MQGWKFNIKQPKNGYFKIFKLERLSYLL